MSWQIAPSCLGQMIADPDRERAARATAAMLTMIKFDIAALEAAYRG